MRFLFILFLSCINLFLFSQKIPVANPDLKPFYHGVASGDPLQDRIIIWTRVTPDILPSPPISVDWEMAADLGFSSIVQSGSSNTDSSRDWTVKVDVANLEAGKTYYYRFKSPGGKFSLTGRTKTAPSGNISNLRFAIVSCSSIFCGYFNAYKRIAERADLDAVIHVGDYIYDFPDESAFRVRPEDSILPKTLQDFRDRHAYYHLDPDQRAVQQQHPFIILWDDHEMSWNRGDSLTMLRYAGAIQAFYEWTPIREPADRTKMQRYFSYGGMADILLTDVTHFRFVPPGSVSNDDPGRKLWGDEQYSWLTGKLKNSTAKWKIVGSAKLFGQWDLIGSPAGTSQGIGMASLISSGDVDNFNADRVRFLKFLRDSAVSNTIVVSGDIHMSIAMDLCENPFNPQYYTKSTGEKSVAVEFAAGSITSENVDEKTNGLLPPSFIDWMAKVSQQINKHHRYCDLVQNGYGILDLRNEKSTAEFWHCDKIMIDTIQKMDAAYEETDGVNHWNRTKLTSPTVPLLAAAPLAPFEELPTALINSHELNGNVEVYPNPVSNWATLKISLEKNQKVDVKLYELASGRILKNVFSGDIRNTALLHIDLGDIPDQTILVSVESANEQLCRLLEIIK